MNRRERRRRHATATTGRTRAAAWPLVAATALILVLAAAGDWLAGTGAFRGATLGGHWSLTAGDGARVTDRDLHGRFVLLYFGYTGCPDVCPTTLSAVADALHRLGEKADRLQPVFVTVDPRHDTPTVIGDYVRSFSARLIGLTGTPSQVATIEREYHVHSAPMAAVSNRGTPMIDHTAVLLLLGPDGRFLAPLPPDETGRALASRLEGFLSS